MRELRGVMTALVTPFDESGALNLRVLPELLEFMRGAGIEGVVIGGTNGEAVSMSVAERKTLLEAALRLRGDLLVLAGTGAASITDAIELTRHAADAGADAALVLPPFFFKNVSAQGVAEYFRRVMDAADIRVLLYSIPQFSAVAVTDEVLDRLKGNPRLAGIKDSAGQWDRTRQLLTERPDLTIFPGSDELLSRALSIGAVGSISGMANPFPDLVAGVKRAYEAGGDVEAAQRRLDTGKSIVLQYPLIGASKAVMANRGVPRMWVRPPLIDLTEKQAAELVGRLREAGAI